MNYVIVDIETTGGGPKTSRITEISILKHNGKEIIDRFTTLINPEEKIPPFVVRLTGISNQMVESAPRFFEVAKDIVQFTEGCIFVAHNVTFDYGILRKEFKQLGFDYRRSHLCTVKASQEILPGHASYGLGKITKELGIELNNHHRAEGDAEATVVLFEMLIKKDFAQLQKLIQKALDPREMHPSLDLNTLDEIPNRCGVYKFYNEFDELIYVGKSKGVYSKIKQHLQASDSKKGVEMRREIARIEYELTGSDAVALIRKIQITGESMLKYSESEQKVQAEELINPLLLDKENFYLIGKGRGKGEKSLLLVENGTLKGIGYAPFHFKSSPIFIWRKYIDFIEGSKAVQVGLQRILHQKMYFKRVDI